MNDSVVATDIRRPFTVKAINTVGKVLNAIGIEVSHLDDEMLINQAMKDTGLSDFGGDEWREGYHILLKSLREEADLNPVGRLTAKSMLVRTLSNRLLITDYIKQHPEVLEQDIKAPFIIAGLPRTGTTILQNLLAADPNSRFMTFWEGSFPCPPKSGKDTRIADTQKEMDIICKFIPGFRSIHDMGAELAQECITLMAMNFTSVQFELNYNVPSYQAWYFKQDLVPTFEFHKKCLQLLQHFNSKQHWVLKTPPYVSAIEPLLEVYPDARILQTHRNPSKVIASVSSLYFALQALSSDSITAEYVGDLELKTWSKHLQLNLESRKRLIDRKEQIYDLYFDELLDEPVKCIERIYQHFDMDWTPELEKIMHGFMANNERNKHGKHHYTPEMYGLDVAEMDKIFAEYCGYFSISKNDR